MILLEWLQYPFVWSYQQTVEKLSLPKQKIFWAYVFLFIPLIFFLYIRIYPTIQAFGMSFYDWNPLAVEQEFIGFDNYAEIFEDVQKPALTSPTRAAFENTVKYVVIGMPLQLVLSLSIALMLSEIRRFVDFYRVIFFLPFVTSTIAVAWVFRWLYQPQHGLFNVVLAAFSLPTQDFLDSRGQALFSILAVVIWQGLGFAVIIFLAGLKQIPRTYYEAAEVDGSSRWQSFWNITLPLLNPSIVYLVVLQTISFLRMFAPVLAMTSQGDGGPLNSTTTVVLRVFREAFGTRSKMGYSAALTVVLFAVILMVTIIQLRLTTRSVD
ncbi:MAG: sugar ABC transporter permease [Anaerolineae bacterium]|nr:sugar ABC transporter permease [Anaerolineae bacterium]MDQ7033852.1 sugar ABC transporter permease [Anaerolineae bacterium]